MIFSFLFVLLLTKNRNAFVNIYIKFPSFRQCDYSFTNMYSPLSHGHYHNHLARCYPLLPFLSIHWPLASPCSMLCIYVFISLWVRGCFGCAIQWRGETRAHLNSHRSGHWRPPLNCIWPVRLYLICVFSSRLCTYMHADTQIHIYRQFSPEVDYHTRNQFTKWFLLKLLSYRGCCKSPTVAIESHGGTMALGSCSSWTMLN